MRVDNIDSSLESVVIEFDCVLQIEDFTTKVIKTKIKIKYSRYFSDIENKRKIVFFHELPHSYHLNWMFHFGWTKRKQVVIFLQFT